MNRTVSPPVSSAAGVSPATSLCTPAGCGPSHVFLPQPLTPPCSALAPLLAASAYDAWPLSPWMAAPPMRFATRPMVSPKKGALCVSYSSAVGKPCTMSMPCTSKCCRMAPRARKLRAEPSMLCVRGVEGLVCRGENEEARERSTQTLRFVSTSEEGDSFLLRQHPLACFSSSCWVAVSPACSPIRARTALFCSNPAVCPACLL